MFTYLHQNDFENALEVLNMPNRQLDSTLFYPEQPKYILSLLDTTLKSNIAGDIVELGCYIGESSKLSTMMLLKHCSEKKLWVYDSFEGLPKPGEYESNWKEGTLQTNREVLEQNFIYNKLPLPNITKCRFNEIKNDELPESISFAFLDGDFYQSIYDSLEKIYFRLSKGAIVTFHDYDRPDLPGVKKAVDDFFSIHKPDRVQFKICRELGVYLHV